MHLEKHTAGSPLSQAERQQRRDAARARWSLVGGGIIGGGGAGAAIAVARRARAGPREMVEAVHAADQAVMAGHVAREATIAAVVKDQLRQVGNKRNLRVYDYQIASLERQLKRLPPGAQAGQVKRQLERLRQLSGKAPVLVARQGTMRFANRAAFEDHLKLLLAQSQAAYERGDLNESVRLEMEHEQTAAELPELQEVAAHPIRAFRGGETAKQITQRIAATKKLLGQRQRTLLSTLERRTAQLRATVRAATMNETEALLHARMRRAGLKGAAIGAAIGLTAAGIALIARHVTDTEPKRLRKATEESPEASMGRGVAESFRDWINRLLGRSTGALNIGDTLARALAPGITQAFAEGASQPPVGGDPQQYHIDVDFDQLNPSVRRHMAEYALDRIVQISNEQREAIRKVLMEQSVLQGIGPRDVARSLRETIGLTPYQMNIVRGYRTELETLDPAALERKLRDARYDPTIKRAIASGTPLSAEQIDAMVAAYHRRMLALRAETIARTESIRATSYGAVARAQDVLDQHPDLDVIKHWIATEDNRTRPTHRDLDGKEVTGMETPFKTSAGNFLRWPIDEQGVADECINCRCAIGFRFIPKTAAAGNTQMAMTG